MPEELPNKRPNRPPSAIELALALSAETQTASLFGQRPIVVAKPPWITRLFAFVVVAMLGVMTLLSSYASRSVENMVGAIVEHRNLQRLSLEAAKIPSDDTLMNNKAFEAFLRANPDDTCNLWRARAGAMVAAKRFEEALAAYIMVRRHADGKIPAVDGLAHAGVLLELKRYDEALSVIALVDITQLPDDLRAKAVGLLATCYRVKQASSDIAPAPREPVLDSVDANPFLAPRLEQEAGTAPAPRKSRSGPRYVSEPLWPPKRAVKSTPTLAVTMPEAEKSISVPVLSLNMPKPDESVPFDVAKPAGAGEMFPVAKSPAPAEAIPSTAEPRYVETSTNAVSPPVDAEAAQPAQQPQQPKPAKVPKLALTMPKKAQEITVIPGTGHEAPMPLEEAMKLAKPKGAPKFAVPKINVTVPGESATVEFENPNKPAEPEPAKPKLSVTTPNPDKKIEIPADPRSAKKPIEAKKDPRLGVTVGKSGRDVPFNPPKSVIPPPVAMPKPAPVVEAPKAPEPKPTIETVASRLKVTLPKANGWIDIPLPGAGQAPTSAKPVERPKPVPLNVTMPDQGKQVQVTPGEPDAKPADASAPATPNKSKKRVAPKYWEEP